jgi:hypothetical protein
VVHPFQYFKEENDISKEIRELTKAEKKAIRILVKNRCANHLDREDFTGCLLMGGPCYMLQKEYCSNSLCRYFRNAVLPNDPDLEAALTDVESRQCPVCGKRYPKSRRKYCSDKCSAAARKTKRKTT